MGVVLPVLEKETGRKCFDTFRRCLDRERASLVEYNDFEREFMSEQGETQRYSGPRDISGIAKDWEKREPFSSSSSTAPGAPTKLPIFPSEHYIIYIFEHN